MKTVYLAGPIAGQSYSGANDWRTRLQKTLRPHGLQGISPLRCEPINGETYSISQAPGNELFGTERAISSKNWFDVNNCDFMVAYLPRGPLSVGTVVEIGWAHAVGTPIILVAEDPKVAGHPVLRSCASWTLDTLDEAAEVLIGVLNDYIPWEEKA